MTNGFFPPSTKVMNVEWSMRILRQLIEVNPSQFRGRLDAHGRSRHSFFIAIKSEPIARASARWDGDSYKKYHRLSQEEDHKWSRKASAGTVLPKMP